MVVHTLLVSRFLKMKRSVQLMTSTALRLKHPGSIQMRSLEQVALDRPADFLGSSFKATAGICLNSYLDLLLGQAGDLDQQQVPEVMMLKHLSPSVSSKPAREQKRKSPLILLPTVPLALPQVSKWEFNVNHVRLVVVQVLERLLSTTAFTWQVPVRYAPE